MFLSISMTAPPTGVLLASNFRCCKVARLRGLSYQGGGKKILRSYASSLCKSKKTLFILFYLFYILLVDSFFYSQGSYIYSHIHSLYNGSVIFGHSDMFVQLVLHILVNVLVPFFSKKCLFFLFCFVIQSRLCHSLFSGMVSSRVEYRLLSLARGACLSSWFFRSLSPFFGLRGCRSSCLECCSMLSLFVFSERGIIKGQWLMYFFWLYTGHTRGFVYTFNQGCI